MQKELKPCPFCGDKTTVLRIEGVNTGLLLENIYMVRCGKCLARGPEVVTSMDDAIKKWNERPALAWTDAPPEKEGFYFIRFGPDKRPFGEWISQADIDGKLLLDGLQWAGPNSLPAETCNKDS